MKILGLDLGVGSVGWALIETDEGHNPLRILGMGSRIVNLTAKETGNFDRGSGETVCSKRTMQRTARKCLDRYQMRRSLLKAFLRAMGIGEDDELKTLSPLCLWHLRSKAVTEKISLPELGRVLLHINQKRGYKHAKTDIGDSKETEYVAKVNQRYKDIIAAGETIGQHFYKEMKNSEVTSSKGNKSVTYRIKDQVFPRAAYIAEFDAIISEQRKYYPELLNDNIVSSLRNAIFYQRPLKSCKHLVGRCEFEKEIIFIDGKEVEIGPKVSPKSSPLAQVTRIWEAINNIRLLNPHNRKKKNFQPSLFDDDKELPKGARLQMEEYVMTPEERQKVFDFMNTHEKMTQKDLFKELGLDQSNGFKVDQNISKGIKGNSTYVAIAKALKGIDGLDKFLEFNLEFTTGGNKETGEVIDIVSPSYEKEPLYRIWHAIYSSRDKEELRKSLSKLSINDEKHVEALYAIDFVKAGYSNKSARCMRKLLPSLIKGEQYSKACENAGYRHSDYKTKEENSTRVLESHLENLKKNSLRQPIVEKVLNQMINVVNELLDRYGMIDEARVELARQLRQNKEKRARTTKAISDKENLNKKYADIIAEHGINPTRTRIMKYGLWEETGKRCMYCGQPIDLTEFIEGNGAEIEHIIPRSIFFDDSNSNKTCACRKCNQEKNNLTAYDYMESKSDEEFTKYVKRVEEMFGAKKISKTKRDRLLTPGNKIPEGFLNRDLTLSQYIARKAVEILQHAIRKVWVTSGSVTDFLRHAWGYDEILHSINLPRYEQADLVKEVTFEHAGQQHKELRIDNWSKRLDHRHHAIDALTVALTRQSYIQRLNRLNSEHDQMHAEILENGYKFKPGHNLLEQWVSSRPHFSTADVTEKVEEISVSFKAGKKLATPGKRYVYKNGKRQLAQEGLLIPRSALHEGYIYGKIKVPSKPVPIKKAFETPELITNLQIKLEVESRLEAVNGDVKIALKNLKKNPIIIKGKDGEEVEVSWARLYQDQFVIKYSIDSIKLKDLDSVVDRNAREAIRKRYDECGNDEKVFKKSLAENPVIPENSKYPIRTVRCFTGLTPEKLVEVRRNSEGAGIGFAKSGNNNHVAFYRTPDGKIETMVTTAWHGIMRKKLGLPLIIKNPNEVWDRVAQMEDSKELTAVVTTLPGINWEYIMDMQMGEMFILGMSEDEYNDAVRFGDKAKLNRYLYRVQKLAMNNYHFRFHTETRIDGDPQEDRNRKALYYLASYNAIKELNPHKVRVTPTGEIILPDD